MAIIGTFTVAALVLLPGAQVGVSENERAPKTSDARPVVNWILKLCTGFT